MDLNSTRTAANTISPEVEKPKTYGDTLHDFFVENRSQFEPSGITPEGLAQKAYETYGATSGKDYDTWAKDVGLGDFVPRTQSRLAELKAKDEWDAAKPADRGFLAGTGAALGRGAMSAVGAVGQTMGLADLTPASIDTDKGYLDTMGEGMTKWAEDKKANTQFMRPTVAEEADENGFAKKAWEGGVESIVTSAAPMASGFAGAKAGAAVGSAFGPVGTAVGSAVGGLGAYGLARFGMFGAGVYGDTYDKTYAELKQKNPGMAEDEVRRIANKGAWVDSISENVSEAVGDAAAFYTFGGTKILQQPLKATIKDVMKRGIKGVAGDVARQMPFEVGSEVANAAVGAQWRAEAGLDGGDANAAMLDAIGPAVVMSLLMGGGVAGYTEVKARKALNDINAADPTTRAKTANEIALQIKERTKDEELAETWRKEAFARIEAAEPIQIDEKIAEFGANKARIDAVDNGEDVAVIPDETEVAEAAQAEAQLSPAESLLTDGVKTTPEDVLMGTDAPSVVSESEMQTSSQALGATQDAQEQGLQQPEADIDTQVMRAFEDRDVAAQDRMLAVEIEAGDRLRTARNIIAQVDAKKGRAKKQDLEAKRQAQQEVKQIVSQYPNLETLLVDPTRNMVPTTEEARAMAGTLPPAPEVLPQMDKQSAAKIAQLEKRITNIEGIPAEKRGAKRNAQLENYKMELATLRNAAQPLPLMEGDYGQADADGNAVGGLDGAGAGQGAFGQVGAIPEVVPGGVSAGVQPGATAANFEQGQPTLAEVTSHVDGIHDRLVAEGVLTQDEVDQIRTLDVDDPDYVISSRRQELITASHVRAAQQRTYARTVGRILRGGGIHPGLLIRQHGNDGAQWLRSRFGLNIIGKEGNALDVWAQALTEEVPEADIRGESDRLYSLLREEWPTLKKINDDYRDYTAALREDIKTARTALDEREAYRQGNLSPAPGSAVAPPSAVDEGAISAPEIKTELDAVANEAATSPLNDTPEPTQAQKEAGNYKKGHVRINGLDFSIENPKGSERKGVDKDGTPWSTTMRNHYSYIKGSVGADKDHVDAFLSDAPESGRVFIVDQVDQKTGAFDEHKAMVGFETEAQAREAYLSNYEQGWQGLGAITPMEHADFKKWVFSKKTKKAVGDISKADRPSAETVTAPVQTEASKFDSAAWNKEREDRIKASKAAGNKHLDDIPAYVETMRGKEVYNAHDPKERGVVRTVSNNGDVVVKWKDKYSADKNMSNELLMPSDLKDYVLAQENKQPPTLPADQRTQEQAGGMASPGQRPSIDERIAEAEKSGAALSDADKAAIRDAAAKAENFRRTADRLSDTDPMNKGNAFPMGVGFTKMTKRKEQAIDSSVRKAGEATKLYEKAERSEAVANSLLEGKGTESDAQDKATKKAENQKKLAERILGLKPGEVFGKHAVVRVNNGKDDYPVSITISGDGVIKGVNDKISIVNELFGGDRDAYRALIDEARKGQEVPIIGDPSFAKRSKRTVDFSANPIVGPSGAKITGYEWRYRVEDVETKNGEDVVAKRVSDWSSADTNSETGRDIVHLFDVTMPNGDTKTASLETALKLLGFTSEADVSAEGKSIISAAKTVAKLRMEVAAQERTIDEYNAALKEVEALPRPVISNDGKWASMGGVRVRVTDGMTAERRQALEDSWTSSEMSNRGHSMSNPPMNKLRDLQARLKKVEGRLERNAKAETAAQISRNDGMRKATKAGVTRVAEAKKAMAEIVNNPDIVGKDRADRIENAKNLVAFLEATAASGLDTGYEFGDKVAYTGDNAPEGMRAFIYLEGAKAGKTGVAATKEAKDARATKAQDDWKRQQEGFRRLKEDAPKSDNNDAKRQMLVDHIATRKANGEPVKQDLLNKLAELEGRIDDAKAKQGYVASATVYGHPEATNNEVHANLIPIIVKDGATIDRAIDRAQKEIDVLQRKLGEADAIVKGRIKTATKPQIKAAKEYLASTKSMEDETALEMLRTETMPELSRLAKLFPEEQAPKSDTEQSNAPMDENRLYNSAIYTGFGGAGDQLKPGDLDAVVSEVKKLGGSEQGFYSWLRGTMIRDDTDAEIAKRQQPETAKAPAKAQEEKAEAPARKSDNRTFRSIDTLNALTKPVEHEDWIKFADGSEWQAKQGYTARGWTLVRDGKAHPTIQSIEGQVELVGAIVQQQDALKTEKAKPDDAGTADAGQELTYNKRNRLNRGLSWSDLKDMNPTLRTKEAVKSKIIPKPDYQAMIDEGTHPVIVHIFKQVYDFIAAKPKAISRTQTEDEAIQLYIDSANRVMDEMRKWATDGRGAEWVKSIGELVLARSGKGSISLSELRQKGRAAGPYEALYPNGWSAARDEINSLGSNRYLRGIQMGEDELVKAMKDIDKGWPGTVAAWKRQGYSIVQVGEMKPTFYVGEDHNKQPYVYIHFTEGRNSAESVLIRGATSATDTRVLEAVSQGRKMYDGKFALLSKNRKIVSAHETEADAIAAAESVTKKKTGTDGIKEEGYSVEASDRTGIEHRMNGEDVTSEKLMEQFGFKGVNFGNWMKGKSNEAERQMHINMAYDSFMDLAQILNVPPKAMSLNGFLGLAIGAQGTGSAAAHFVPGVNEINLTRASGAGAVAHEWAHGLDHYFANIAGLSRSEEPFITEHTKRNNIAIGEMRPEVMAKFAEVVKAMERAPMSRAEIEAQVDSRKSVYVRNIDSWLKSMRQSFLHGIPDSLMVNKNGKSVNFAEEFDRIAARIRIGDVEDGKVALGRTTFVSPVVAELRDLYMLKKVGNQKPRAYSLEDFKSLQANVDSILYYNSERAQDKVHEPQTKGSDYANESLKADKDKKGKRYWSTKLEMFARAFAGYVYDRLEAAKSKNSYLVRPSSADSGEAKAYAPVGEDRKRINAAFDALVKELKTKKTDKGVAMYQVAQNTTTPSPVDLRAAFPWADSIETDGDGRTVITKGKVSFAVTQVETISPDEVSFQLAYGRKPGAQDQVAGEYRSGEIRLSKVADQWTVMHEYEHFLEDMGLITKFEQAVLDAAIKKAEKDGTLKFDPGVGKDRMKPAELRAYYVQHELAARDFQRKTTLGRVLQKVADFIDALANLFVRTSRGVVRDVESGAMMGRESLQADVMNIMGSQYALAPTLQKAKELKDDILSRPEVFGRFNFINTQLHKALRQPAFKRIFDRFHAAAGTQQRAAARAASLAPDILPDHSGNFKQSVRELFTRTRDFSSKDLQHVSRVMSMETLSGKDASPFSGHRLTEDELTRIDAGETITLGGNEIAMTKKQVELYRQSRAALDQMLTEMATSEAWRIIRGVLTTHQSTAGEFDARDYWEVFADQPNEAGAAMHDMLNRELEKGQARLTQAEMNAHAIASADDMDGFKAYGKTLTKLNKALDNKDKFSPKQQEDGDLDEIIAKREERIEKLADELGIDASDAEERLKEYKAALKEYNDASQHVENVNGAFKQIADVFKKSEQLIKAGYAPLSRFGRYRIDVHNDEGELIHVSFYDTSTEAARERRGLIKAFEGYDGGANVGEVETVSQEEWKQFQGANPEALRLFAQKAGADSEEVVQAFYQNAISSRSALKRLINRQGYAGYSEDLQRILASFITSGSKRIGSNYHAADITEMINDKTLPNDLLDEARKLKAFIDNPGDAGSAFRSFAANWYMLGSFMSAAWNGTQVFTSTVPELYKHGGSVKGAFGEVLKSYRSLIRKGADFSVTEKAALKRAMEDGTVDAAEIHHLYAQATKRFVHRLGDGEAAKRVGAFLRLWGMPFSWFEVMNRKATFIAAYRMGEAQGVDDAYAFAKQMVDITQGIYAKHNRMNLARGPVMGSVMTFMQYKIMTLEQIARNAKEGGQARKAAALQLAIIAAMGGWKALPGIEDITDLYDTIMQAIFGKAVLSKKSMREAIEKKSVEAAGLVLEKEAAEAVGQFFANAVNNGIVTASLPFDVSGRAAVGNLIPGLKLLKPSTQYRDSIVFDMAGVPGSMIDSLIDASGMILQGDMGRAAMRLAPNAIAAVAKGADILATGEIRNTRGKKVTDGTPLDAALQTIGAQPKEKSRINNRLRENQELKFLTQAQEKSIVAEWADAYEKKGVVAQREALLAVRKRIADWNTNNPDWPIVVKQSQVMNELKNRKKTTVQLASKSAPKELRQSMAVE